MLQLSNLSKIGFGCHLLSIECEEHYDALLHALNLGCNLIDTSANYMKGKSEALIGKVLKENPQHEAFIVTKSGYDESENLALVKDGITWNEIIHPDFLRNRIALSLDRLCRTTIDCFLLHSPESYLNPKDIQPFPNGFYAGIKRAFEFLEEEVKKGAIRYYGISSNTFHLCIENTDTIDLRKVFAIANSISASHHFKFIEFPFNLGEMDALKRHHGQTSLTQLAHDNGIVTLTNRPLNAKTPLGPIRLAIYKDYEQLLDYQPDRRLWDDSMKLIAKRLRKLGAEDELMNFAIVRHLDEFWTTIGNPEGVIQIFQNYFHPFLHHIYEGNIPNKDAKVYLNLYEAAILCSRKTMTQKTLEFQRMLSNEGTIREDDHRPLPVIACEFYLNSGIDHVLIGMRKREYVNMMSSFFDNNRFHCVVG